MAYGRTNILGRYQRNLQGLERGLLGALYRAKTNALCDGLTRSELGKRCGTTKGKL